MKFEGIKEQGVYTTNVGVDFYSFQRTLKDLSLGTITCLTSDKIELSLKAKVQIRLQKDSLIPFILKKFGSYSKYNQFLTTYVSSEIIDSCLAFTAEQYYLNRSYVDSTMFGNLQQTINTKAFGAKVEFFQLNEITLPSGLSTVITEKQNIEQQSVTAMNDRQNALITATTNLLKAEQESQVTLIEANNTATIINNQAMISQRIIQTEWQNRGEAYSAVVQNFGFGKDDFLDYLRSEVLRSVEKAVVQH
jgi:regulator of protease activity HflC (stomatin/prohibitin superfamily)